MNKIFLLNAHATLYAQSSVANKIDVLVDENNHNEVKEKISEPGSFPFKSSDFFEHVPFLDNGSKKRKPNSGFKLGSYSYKSKKKK